MVWLLNSEGGMSAWWLEALLDFRWGLEESKE